MNNYLVTISLFIYVALFGFSMASTRPPNLNIYETLHHDESLEPRSRQGRKLSRSFFGDVKLSRSLDTTGEVAPVRVRREPQGTHTTIVHDELLEPRSRQGRKLSRSVDKTDLEENWIYSTGMRKREVNGEEIAIDDPIVKAAVKLAAREADIKKPIRGISAHRMAEGLFTISYQGGQEPNIASCTAKVKDHQSAKTPRLEILEHSCIA